MQLALTGLTALRAWRAIRSGACPDARVGNRIDLPMPDPAPAKRWTAKCFDLGFLGIDALASGSGRPINVATPNAKKRIRTTGIECTTYANLPSGAYVDVGHGVAIASPELVFVELGAHTRPEVQLLLGYELCGGFSRDADSPRDGKVTYGIPSVTTVEKIVAFLAECRYVPGTSSARLMLPYLRENAWSPTEAVIAALAVMEWPELGYELGDVVLNRRINVGHETTRVPDILFAGTHVGLNYDGGVHFGLRDIVAAAGTSREQEAVAQARARIVGDKRRSRELLAAGYTVLPVTSEDLYEKGGLDAVMSQVADLIERETGRDLSEVRTFASSPLIVKERQRLIWSLLPGRRGEDLLREMYARDQRMIKAFRDAWKAAFAPIPLSAAAIAPIPSDSTAADDETASDSAARGPRHQE